MVSMNGVARIFRAASASPKVVGFRFWIMEFGVLDMLCSVIQGSKVVWKPFDYSIL